MLEGKWIFSRTACLGNEALSEMTGLPRYRVNLQKGRIDQMLILLSKSKRKRPKLYFSKFFRRADIFPLIWQQCNKSWIGMPPPSFVVLDSFADLTDQEFVDMATGRNFYCAKSDLQENFLKTSQLVNLGFLDLDEIESQYELFLQKIQTLWGGVDVYYVHFPSKLENREFYISRAASLLKATRSLEKRFPLFHVITVPESLVFGLQETGELQGFPYHFTQESKIYVANEINNLQRISCNSVA